ncbi:hypothetical protein BDV28DRAFT_144304 [Aspergillus coremiiformis]|uniref:Secreted protein n=1 Tax=Aspergillus coremiiformis TaxID=138285 RepID=A0A5N6YT83_9EURO|nr:hypothetical protein BDV28DRAFT_144304 [Aspergillus coremiiformis]
MFSFSFFVFILFWCFGIGPTSSRWLEKEGRIPKKTVAETVHLDCKLRICRVNHGCHLDGLQRQSDFRDHASAAHAR